MIKVEGKSILIMLKKEIKQRGGERNEEENNPTKITSFKKLPVFRGTVI